jgi:hypothetical protein
MRCGWLALALVLAGCAGAGGWAKPNWTRAGADEASAAREYEECRAMAATAVKTDADIDQDIAATRGDDRQRAQVFRRQIEIGREHTRDRAASIVDACMRAKGFAAPR